MHIAIGSDHRGFTVKSKVKSLLERLGHDVTDAGTEAVESVDYPDFAAAVGGMVSRGDAERGILICGTGIGMAVTANKLPGVRAATCYDDLTAEMSRRHNDVNVLCLGADLLGEPLIDRMVETWLTTEFEGGRHSRRVDKIVELENRRDDR